MTATLRLRTRSEFERSWSFGGDPLHAVRVEFDAVGLRLEAVDMGEGALPRVTRTMPYICELYRRATDLLGEGTPSGEFYFQAADAPRDLGSVSWQAKADWASVRLVPDLYYFTHHGYQDFRPKLRGWQYRRDAIAWRGNTTGNPSGITVETLADLPRYRVLSALESTPMISDVGFTTVVQAKSGQMDAIAQRLHDEDLVRPFVDPLELGASRYLLNVDGNTSSWNFLQRLRTGACLLIVESTWTQWYHSSLRAGEHYVSIKADLSNLDEQVRWCLDNPSLAEEIAWNGLRLGLSYDFENEMTKAALLTFGAGGVEVTERMDAASGLRRAD